MTIKFNTRKIIWARSGNMCAYPDCRRSLVTEDTSIVGEEAHIIGKRSTGPRGESEIPEEILNHENNLILLCPEHHKIVDDHPLKYRPELLREYKVKHEEWVKQNLIFDKIKEGNDQCYADYIDTFIQLANIDSWQDWTYDVFYNRPSILSGTLKNLKQLLEFIMNRVWFGRYPDLERGFNNFKEVTSDFISLFEMHIYWPKNMEGIEFSNEKIIRTAKFYQDYGQEKVRYSNALKMYKYHTEFLQDLIIEMTRSVNYLFDMVRKYLFAGFRISEGIVRINFGHSWGNSWKNLRVEYKENEKTMLYPGAKEFAKIRADRNYSIGKGYDEEYFKYF
jgi:hypothetical protein